MIREDLESLSSGQLIDLILQQQALIEQLMARLAELEAHLGQPPKTPANSSIPPAKVSFFLDDCTGTKRTALRDEEDCTSRPDRKANVQPYNRILMFERVF